MSRVTNRPDIRALVTIMMTDQKIGHVESKPCLMAYCMTRKTKMAAKEANPAKMIGIMT